MQSFSPLLLPRSYPRRFGVRIAQLHHSMCKTAFKWKVPRSLRRQSAQDLYEKYEWGDLWDRAQMHDVLVYLKGNYRLKLPLSWARVLPNTTRHG